MRHQMYHSREIGAKTAPCPFCGYQPELFEGDDGTWCIICRCCKVGYEDVASKVMAVQKWNGRAKHNTKGIRLHILCQVCQKRLDSHTHIETSVTNDEQIVIQVFKCKCGVKE